MSEMCGHPLDKENEKRNGCEYRMKIISSGVTAPKGFQAAGLRAGIKAGKTNKDMALIYSEAPAVCAGTFTSSIVKAAPVLWEN